MFKFIPVKDQLRDVQKQNIILTQEVNHNNAVTDYNVMMGILEDPSEEEDLEDE